MLLSGIPVAVMWSVIEGMQTPTERSYTIYSLQIYDTSKPKPNMPRSELEAYKDPVDKQRLHKRSAARNWFQLPGRTMRNNAKVETMIHGPLEPISNVVVRGLAVGTVCSWLTLRQRMAELKRTAV